MSMNSKISALLREIGRPYQMYNDDGTYQGCFYPVQFIYRDKPCYKLQGNDSDQNYYYGLRCIREHCTPISLSELEPGDIIATRFKNELHVAVYYQFGKVIEVFRGHSLQIGSLKKYKKIICFRVIK